MAGRETEPLEFFQGSANPRLYDRLPGFLRMRRHSPRTEEPYVHRIRRYIEFHQHRHPRRPFQSDLNRFLTHPAVERHPAAFPWNQASSAVLFLHEHALNRGGRGARSPADILVRCRNER